MKKRVITSKDLIAIKTISDPQVSPDGKSVVYVIRQPDKNKNTYYSNLWILSFSSGIKKQLTFGDQLDYSPRWSPDGSLISFLSVRGAEKKCQVYVINPNGGEAQQITDLDGTFQDLDWSPDQQLLVFSFRLSRKKHSSGKYPENYKPAYRITSLRFREDGTNKIITEHFHIYSVALEDKKTRQLTKGSWDDYSPRWLPSGKEIAFLSNRIPNRELDPENVDIWFINPKTGNLRKLPKPRGPVEELSISMDGKYIAYIGHTGAPGRSSSSLHHVWLVPVNGRKKAFDLMPSLDATTLNLSINDLKSAQGFNGAPVFSPGNNYVYFLVSKHGTTNLYRISITNGKLDQVTNREWEVSTFTSNKTADRFAMVISQWDNPSDIYTLKIPRTRNKPRNTPRRITYINQLLTDQLHISKPVEIWFEGYDNTSIQGWYLLPPNFNKNKKYPMLLEIHGGPHLQYAYNFFHEIQYLAANGYVVLYVNPHGSHGYGEKFSRSIDRDWGGPDYLDLMKAVDYMITLGFVDPKKLGVLGGSYGGFMTNWIIGHTNRFAAAVTQRSLVNVTSFFGTCDVGLSFLREMETLPWTDHEFKIQQSPLSYSDKINTPLLIIHSENDKRTPIEQAEQLFTALKIQGKTVQFIRFPDEGHELSRGGQPLHRLERLQHILKWFDRYLKRPRKIPGTCRNKK